MTLELRLITDDEVPAFRNAMMTAFGEDDHEADPDGHERFRKTVDIGRAWGAFDNGTLVATTGTFVMQFGLPGGGSLPVAGLTMVSVRPTHRRRGILRGLIDLHLQEAASRSIPASALWASEAGIYQRFGYGLASHSDSVEIDQAHSLTLPPSSDEPHLVDEATARQLLPDLYARATKDRPGVLRRTPNWWAYRRFIESPFSRKGASLRRHVIVKRAGEPVGYVVYRQRPKWENDMPTGRIEINELFAVDLAAETALWRYVCAIDLFPKVTWWNAPTDCPLPWLIADPRRYRRHRSDNLWLRIADVPACLALRGYTADGELRFATTGTTYELVVANGIGRCAPTSAAAQVTLRDNALAALYLGGTSAFALHKAGLVEGSPSAIALADRLFASPVAPWSAEVF